MSLSVHCCEGMNISKLFCNWCQSSKKKKSADLEQVLYTDSIKQIVILSTPQIDCPELLLYEDLKDTDIVIFSLDEDNQIRFASVQGSHLLKALTSTFSVAPNNNLPPKITSNKDIAGHTLDEILPDYITRFLLPIYRQTLQGNYLQLTTMWMRTTQLVRTFPILNHKKEVIAGIAITSPFNPDFNGDINKFSLNRPEEKKKRHNANNHNPDNGPAPQSMEEKKIPTRSQNFQQSTTPRTTPTTPQHHRKLTDPSPRKRPVSVDTSIPLFDQGGPIQVTVPNSTEEHNINDNNTTDNETTETTAEAENSINNKVD